MKELYANNAGKALLEDKGFFIIDTSFIPFIITDYTYVKDKWGALHIVNFVDCDKIDFSNFDITRSNFLKELDFFKEKTNANAVIYYKILITECNLSEDSVENILQCHSHSLITKASFIPVIVDMYNNKIIVHPNNGIDKTGIISMLDNLLISKENISNTYNLREIQKRITQNYGDDSPDRSDAAGKPGKLYITYFLMAVNISLFIIMELAGGTQNPYVLKYFGIKINSLIASGEYWRLLASTFIHIGFAHVAFNMYGLYNLGTLAESIYGSKKYLLIYLSSALWGSISSFIFSPAPSAGASGAIFGLLGSLIYLWQKKPRIFVPSFWINILVVIAFNLVYGFTNTGIDNFAHMGGLLGGYLSSNVTGLKYEKDYNIKRLVLSIVCVLLLFIGFAWGVRKNI